MVGEELMVFAETPHYTLESKSYAIVAGLGQEDFNKIFKTKYKQ